MLIDDALAHHERYRPDRPAVRFGDELWTYRRLGETRARCANLLLGLGVRHGDRVALLSENTPYFLVALFATVRIGAVFVPLNYRLSAGELHEILRDAGVRVLIGQPRHLERLLGAGALPDGCVALALGPFADVPDVQTLLLHAAATAPAAHVRTADPALLQYTSGTTGEPKGVISVQGGWVQSCLIQPPLKRITSESIFLGILPMCYTGGTKAALEVVFAGALNVIMQRFDEDEALAAVERHRVTNAFVVPTMLYRLLDARATCRGDLSSLRYINSGGAPLNEDRLVQAIETFGCQFTQSYGMTEIAGGSITFAGPEDFYKDGRVSPKLTSVGQPMIDCAIRLVDEHGREAAVGEPGEVLVRTRRTLRGYWGVPDQASPVDEDGFYHTGDVARMDDDGYLYIVDRKKDMIISGGLNIYSKEVEVAIERHAAVSAAYVVGAPDPQWGESVVAFVVVHDGESLSASDVQDWCVARLGRYKRPRDVVFLARQDVPVNWGGKVVKRMLRDEYLLRQHDRTSQ